MESRNSDLVFSTTLPDHCTPTTAFLYSVSSSFGTCLPTPLAFTSTLFGYLSVLSWLCAQMPQIYKNYKIKSAAGLSLFFLVEWLLGDITNLLGSIFTGQATWQVVVASYYCFVDVCLVFQFFWYSYALPWWREGSIYSSDSDSDDDDASSDIINSLSPINSSFIDDNRDNAKHNQENSSSTEHQTSTKAIDTPHFNNVNYEKGAANPSFSVSRDQWGMPNWTGPSPRTALQGATFASMASRTSAAPLFTTESIHFLDGKTPIQIAGTILSWCSTVLYLGSRMPQLYKNWQRQSTAGLSPYLFIAAFCGNFFYSASMLTNPKAWYNFGPYGGNGWADETGSNRAAWVINAAPFFLGAFGVLFLDGAMGIQFLIYGEEMEKVVKVREVNGPSRWQKVSGWMRGWIPTVKKEKVVDMTESQRLLSESRGLDRTTTQTRYGGT